MDASERESRFLGNSVSEAQLAMIRQVVGDYQALSRMELAATVCELLGWTRGNGKPKARECREWLEKLEQAGRLSLPTKRPGRPLGSTTSIPGRTQTREPRGITGSAGDLGPIRIQRVTDQQGRLQFRELIGHYLSGVN